jgi:hypothetical protein
MCENTKTILSQVKTSCCVPHLLNVEVSHSSVSLQLPRSNSLIYHSRTAHSTAGNWLFSHRRWRDPRDSEDLEALEREYARLCSSFPRFATACSKDRFISCIAGICASWIPRVGCSAAPYSPQAVSPLPSACNTPPPPPLQLVASVPTAATAASPIAPSATAPADAGRRISTRSLFRNAAAAAPPPPPAAAETAETTPRRPSSPAPATPPPPSAHTEDSDATLHGAAAGGPTLSAAAGYDTAAAPAPAPAPAPAAVAAVAAEEDALLEDPAELWEGWLSGPGWDCAAAAGDAFAAAGPPLLPAVMSA